MEKRREEVRRKVRREIVIREDLCLLLVGARRSESVPVRRRAMVDVTARIDTCVAGEFDFGGPEDEGG